MQASGGLPDLLCGQRPSALHDLGDGTDHQKIVRDASGRRRGGMTPKLKGKSGGLTAGLGVELVQDPGYVMVDRLGRNEECAQSGRLTAQSRLVA